MMREYPPLLPDEGALTWFVATSAGSMTGSSLGNLISLGWTQIREWKSLLVLSHRNRWYDIAFKSRLRR